MKYPSRQIRAPALAHLFEPYPSRKIYGAILHSTRSTITDGDDGPRTENWMLNPSNNKGGWGGSCDEIIFENGQRVIVNPDGPRNTRHAPTYGAGYSAGPSFQTGWWYWNIEIALRNLNDPFTPESVESTAERCAELAEGEGLALPHDANQPP